MTDIENKEAGKKGSLSFIEQAVENGLKVEENGGRVRTRFPPEPNGYLHIGHARATCLDLGIAVAHGGVCNLRFDDINPTKEGTEYVEAIQEDIRWLGFQWGNVYYASDYFQQLWNFAVALIKEGKVYIGEQTSEQIAQQKGTLTQPGVESPYHGRPIEESLALFEKMNNDEVKEGSMILHAKIDMASPNMHFRGPIMYRILHVAHHRTGTRWKAYPVYDFAHGQSDCSKGVTHSLYTLKFVPHHPFYDLFIDWLKEGKDLNDNRPRQTEFNKLSLSYTLMSRRSLLILAKEGLVNDWDDPRMSTLCGFRHRGYSPESIRKFVDKISYTTYDALNDLALFENAIRRDLNARATHISAALNPVKLIITNYPEGRVEELDVTNNPEDPATGGHTIEFSRGLQMGRKDFMEDAPKKYFRVTPGQEVCLKNAYIVKHTGCRKDENSTVTEVCCEYDPNTKSGMPDVNHRARGTLRWVDCAHCLSAEIRLYDRLWKVEGPRDGMAAIRGARGCDALEAMKEMINPGSLTTPTRCYIGKYVADLPVLSCLQSQRVDYFNVDKDSMFGHLILNRTVGLKDTWGKINK